MSRQSGGCCACPSSRGGLPPSQDTKGTVRPWWVPPRAGAGVLCPGWGRKGGGAGAELRDATRTPTGVSGGVSSVQAPEEASWLESLGPFPERVTCGQPELALQGQGQLRKLRHGPSRAPWGPPKARSPSRAERKAVGRLTLPGPHPQRTRTRGTGGRRGGPVCGSSGDPTPVLVCCLLSVLRTLVTPTKPMELFPEKMYLKMYIAELRISNALIKILKKFE